jgi:hypothetical protein
MTMMETDDDYPSKRQVNPICHFLALLGAHPILHVSRIRVKLVQFLFGEVLWLTTATAQTES